MHRSNKVTDYTMAASKTFEALLSKIQSSNLHFKIEQYPFSAVISIKKSLIRDQAGNLLEPPPLDSILLIQAKTENQNLNMKIANLENFVNSIQNQYACAVDECANATKKIAMLEKELETSETGEAITAEISELRAGNSELVKTNKCLVKELADLKVDLAQVNIEKNIYDQRKRELEQEI